MSCYNCGHNLNFHYGGIENKKECCHTPCNCRRYQESPSGYEDYTEVRATIAKSVDYIKHLEFELNTFKQVIADFTGKSKKELDNIVPEDLEYALLKYQSDIEKRYTDTLSSDEQAVYSWNEIQKLYRILRTDKIPKDLNDLAQVKIFIKRLARENAANKT